MNGLPLSSKLHDLDDLRLNDLVIVMVSPRNPLNIGAAARAMTNFGVHRLRLVECYAPAFREARSAVGAADVLKSAEDFGTVAEAIADCARVVGTTAVRDRDLQHPVRTLGRESGAEVRKELLAGRVAILFGSEKYGLSNDDLSHCHWLLRIPTHKTNISMNLGQAVAVCLYEIARATPVKGVKRKGMKQPGVKEETERATVGAAEMISELLLENLRKSGYVKPGNDAMVVKKVRRLVLRLDLNALDAKILLGMVRQIAWKLKQAEK